MIIVMQFMSGKKSDRMCVRAHTCKIGSTSEKSPQTTRSNVPSRMPNRDFVVATGTLVTVTFCFQNATLSCFILNETLDMLQQQETLNFGYTNRGLHMQLYTSTSNHSCNKGARANWRSCINFFLAWTVIGVPGDKSSTDSTIKLAGKTHQKPLVKSFDCRRMLASEYLSKYQGHKPKVYQVNSYHYNKNCLLRCLTTLSGQFTNYYLTSLPMN